MGLCYHNSLEDVPLTMSFTGCKSTKEKNWQNLITEDERISKSTVVKNLLNTHSQHFLLCLFIATCLGEPLIYVCHMKVFVN